MSTSVSEVSSDLSLLTGSMKQHIKPTFFFFFLPNLHRECVLHEHFSALHVFITLSNIKHDQQLFYTLIEPTANKNDFHHHINLDAGSIM